MGISKYKYWQTIRKRIVNEQIIEMAKQCGDWNGQTLEMNDAGIIHFAELIVRECALTAGLMEHEGRPNIGAQILDNFGVE
jgi:hypothetical protein